MGTKEDTKKRHFDFDGVVVYHLSLLGKQVECEKTDLTTFILLYYENLI